MASRLLIDVFCEDSGHEAFLRNLVRVLAQASGVSTPQLHVHSACGGHGRAITSLKSWQRALHSGMQPRGDALLVMIDANSTGWRGMVREIQAAVDSTLYPTVLIGCPDPHVEVWCTADPQAFNSVFSVPVPQAPARSGRLVYKQWLATSLEQAGVLVLTDPMDICLDLLPAMDMTRACRNDDSLDYLIRDIKALLNRHSQDR